MGIYYMAVNHTKREKVNPHDLDEGAKLMECQIAKTLFWLLMSDRWKGDDVEVITDLADERWARIDDEYKQIGFGDDWEIVVRG